jgi:hypothetical protein
MCAMMQKLRMIDGSVAAGTGAVRACGDTLYVLYCSLWLLKNQLGQLLTSQSPTDLAAAQSRGLAAPHAEASRLKGSFC